MGGETVWKACDSCNSAAAALFCRVDSAFLCLHCDPRVHAAANARHARVWLCGVCEQAPATVTCKADSASLCSACDRHVHSANPLSSRHERLPVVPFFGSPPASATEDGPEDDTEEVASWLLPNPKDDADPLTDLDLMAGDRKSPHHQHHCVPSAAACTAADGVVPVAAGKTSNDNNNRTMLLEKSVASTRIARSPSTVDGVPWYYDSMEYSGSKPFLVYDFNSRSISQSVSSSSSLEVGVVPNNNNTGDVSTASLPNRSSGHETVPLSGIDREARVMRYREKRRNRKFEKTIRYASRKAYAETRPRIKGRFAKRTEGVDLDGLYDVPPHTLVSDAGYGVVPSF